MNSELLWVLISTTLASSAAIVLVGLLRRLIRTTAGARAAYWLWLLVPAMVAAVLLPSAPPLLNSVQITVPEQVRSAFLAATDAGPSSNGVTYVDLALAVWIAGGIAMFLYMFARQWSFVRSLGALTRHADGLYRCEAAVAPMLLGNRSQRGSGRNSRQRRESRSNRTFAEMGQ
jgi:beta-lactamase regulating signal transducer with metallopeptidase domain